MPPAVPLICTLAPWMTAPLLSLTVPVITPVSCAHTFAAANKLSTTTPSNRRIFIDNSTCHRDPIQRENRYCSNSVPLEFQPNPAKLPQSRYPQTRFGLLTLAS